MNGLSHDASAIVVVTCQVAKLASRERERQGTLEGLLSGTNCPDIILRRKLEQNKLLVRRSVCSDLQIEQSKTFTEFCLI